MKTIFFTVFLFVTSYSCKNAEKIPIEIDFSFHSCDFLNSSKLAPLINLQAVDLISQSTENTLFRKVCTQYINKKPQPQPVFHLEFDKNNIQNGEANYAQTLKDLLENPTGNIKYKILTDERFNAIYTEDTESYNQAFVEINNEYLILLQFDKTILKNKSVEELTTKIIEIILLEPKKY